MAVFANWLWLIHAVPVPGSVFPVFPPSVKIQLLLALWPCLVSVVVPWTLQTELSGFDHLSNSGLLYPFHKESFSCGQGSMAESLLWGQ